MASITCIGWKRKFSFPSCIAFLKRRCCNGEYFQCPHFDNFQCVEVPVYQKMLKSSDFIEILIKSFFDTF